MVEVEFHDRPDRFPYDGYVHAHISVG